MRFIMDALMATYGCIRCDHGCMRFIVAAYFINEEAQSASEADVVGILLRLCRSFMVALMATSDAIMAACVSN